jgi:hypothetical protein
MVIMKLIYEKWVQRRGMKREWVYHPKIRTFFWDRGPYERMVNRKLETDEEFMAWCEEHDCNVHETWVECLDDRTASLFLLRWT